MKGSLREWVKFESPVQAETIRYHAGWVNRMSIDSKQQGLYYQILIFLVLAAGIILTGYLYFQSYEQEYRSGVENQLTSVGDLKVDELVRWRNERIGDARVFVQNNIFSSQVYELQHNPEKTRVTQDLVNWLSNVQSQYHYNRVSLVSPQGKMLISAPDLSDTVSPTVLAAIPTVYKKQDITVLDFYRDESDQKIYLTILAPIFDPKDTSRLQGVLALQIDPEKYLYPFISKWPVPSSSAETLLIRREGDTVLFLNDLRFREDTALSFRISLNQTDLPAVKAALGQEGIVEGIDYRGVAVIANIREIPDSPWFLVARIDSEEVFRPLQTRALDLTLIIIFLLIGTGTVLYLINKRDSERFYQEQLKIKDALRESEVLLRGIFDTMPSGAAIYSVKNDGSKGSDYIISDFNQASLLIEGKRKEEVVGRSLADIRPNIDEFGLIQIFQKVWKTGKTEFYPAKIYVDDTYTKWYENYVFRLPTGQIVAIYNDVTEKNQAEEALLREQERLFAVLEQIPAFVYLQASDYSIPFANRAFHELFGKISGRPCYEVIPGRSSPCDECPTLAVLQTGKPVVWEWKNPDGRTFMVYDTRFPSEEQDLVLEVGIEITDLKKIEEHLKKSEGRLQTLIHTIPDLIWLKDKKGVYLACNTAFERFIGAKERDLIGKSDYDFLERELAEFFREHDRRAVETGRPSVNEEWITFADNGHRSLLETIKTPMYDTEGTLIGVLGIGRDITERKAIEEQINLQNQRLEQSQTIGHLGSWEYDLRTGTIWGSDEGFRIYGMNPPADNKLPIDEIESCIPERERVHQALIDLIEGKSPYNLEFAVHPADGSPERTIISFAEIITDESGAPIKIAGVIQDVTSRKQTEIERDELILRLRQNNEHLNAAYEELAGSEEELKAQYTTLAATEERLREKTEYLDNLITFANVPIIVWDPGYTITRINHAFENLVGKTADQLIGESIRTLFPTDKAEHSMMLIETTKAGVRWDTLELGVLHHDGTIKTVIWNSATLYSHDGETLIATIAQGQDITDRKRLEEENNLALYQIQKNLAQLSILNDQIRNPLMVILMSADMGDDEKSGVLIAEQISLIDDIVNQLDKRWMESEKVLTMIRKNYQIIISPQSDKNLKD
jgi:PAS domain S-box-containing protein